MRGTTLWLAGAILSLTPGTLTAQAGADDSLVYVLAPASRFDVHTGSAGLFAFAGHDHLIRARAFSGRIVYRPGAQSASRVELLVRTDSLEVLTPPDTEEIRKVTASMRDAVLEVARYPEIRFASTAVRSSPQGFTIQGTLTMHGQAHEVVVSVHTALRGDTLTAQGSFTVKQTDYGIRPYRVGPGGVVRVADRIRFDFDAVAIRPEAGR
jgi:polyisoprenoid-binding protein YceI